MITSFADKETAKIFHGEASRKLPGDIQEGAREALVILASVGRIEDLWAFPSLRAEKLKGSRKGQWSIRINKQWRITFFWDEANANAAEAGIEDYH